MAVVAMSSQRPAHSLAEFELPAEEFEDWTLSSANSSNDLHTLFTEARRSLWRKKETLGRGSCGHVWLQERDVDLPTPHARAVKQVALSQLSKDGIDHLNEISAMARFSKLKHGDCAVFGEFYGYAKNDDTLFLAMEYFPHRDLKRHIEARPMDEQEAKKIVYDILVGLKMMHAEGIVHRDLKPENIFVSSKPPESRWSVKIADFGISKRIPPKREWNLTLRRGTRYYTAPEVEGLIDHCQYNPGAMDMWSLGVIVYFLATQQFPFAPREVALFCRNDGKFPFPRRPMLEWWSEEGLAFVQDLLRPSPRDRLSAEDALRHPWITSMIEGLVGPPSSLALSTSMLSVKSLDEVDKGLVIGNQDTASESSANLPLMSLSHIHLPPSILSTPSWPGPPQTTPYPRQELLTIPLELPSYPRSLSPFRMITAPMSYADEIPSASFYDFTTRSSRREKSRPRRPRGNLDRRATAPTPLWQVEDAIDLISPRTNRTEVASPFRLERSPEREVRDSTSSAREMSLTRPQDPHPSPPPQHTSLVWRDTRLKSFRSKSDSFVRPSYKADHITQERKRASALEFVNDPRFHDCVHAFYHAIRGGREDVVDLLLDRDVDIETVFRDPPRMQYGTALHLAVSCGQAGVVEVLLRRGAYVAGKARAELSKFHMRWLEPLHLAAYYGLDEIARMLLAQGARIEANAIGSFKNREKRTPLHLAVLGDESDEIPRMVRLLLEYGADPNVKDDMGMRPGDYAVMLGQRNLEADLPSSSSSKLKARVVKMRLKFGPFALAGPLILGAAGVAMIMK